MVLSCEQRRIEELLEGLSFIEEERSAEYSDRINKLIETNMHRILEEQFNSFENTDVLLGVVSSRDVRGSLKRVI